MDEAVRRYIDSIPAEQRPLFDRLQSLVLELYPDADIVLSYQVPTYKVGGGRVSLGLWKDGVSLYTTDPQHIESFTSKHPTVKSGKASLNFTLTDELPVEDLGEVVHREIQRRGGSASA